MVVVVGEVITTRDHSFLLVREENNGGKESRCCDAIFGPRNLITDAAVKVLHLIRENRRGGRQ